jgi:hypothetical protein
MKREIIHAVVQRIEMVNPAGRQGFFVAAAILGPSSG